MMWLVAQIVVVGQGVGCEKRTVSVVDSVIISEALPHQCIVNY